MKKIWPWLLLLLLLIIFCVWTKKDSIQITPNKTVAHATTTPIIAEKKHYIDYSIVQNDNHYVLNGNFTNTQQQNSLSDTCTATASKLILKGTATNATLVGDEAIALTNKILPHFIKNYQDGKITYANNKLTLFGNTNSYESQHEMQRLLNSSTLASQDNTNVIVKKPIHFTITKASEGVSFTGSFNSEAQSNKLQTKLPANTRIHLEHASRYVDKGVVDVIEGVLPNFVEKYKHGKIEYKEEILTITGIVSTQDDLNQMNDLISRSSVHIINHTTIDEEALARAKAQKEAEEARLAEEEAKRIRDVEALAKAKAAEEARLMATKKAQEEANNARLEAERRAEEEAKRVRDAEALLKAKAAEEARLAELAATRKAQELKQAQEAKIAVKAKIAKLLQIENIEFEVAKGSLTPRGKGTIDKLANILTQYPNIKAEIAGHTDSDGSAQFNQKLSQSRVDTAKKRLISKGISASRLTAKGYGESRPLVPNTSDANKQRNRRVEIIIQGE